MHVSHAVIQHKHNDTITMQYKQKFICIGYAEEERRRKNLKYKYEGITFICVRGHSSLSRAHSDTFSRLMDSVNRF